MKCVEEVLQLSADYLSKRGVSAARRQAEELLAGALGLKRLQLYMDFQRPLSEQELARARERLARRAAGEPLAYIEGSVEFYACQIAVGPQVLIPRPESELLVDRAAKILKDQDLEGKTLVDICCGSGCLGIALKKSLPQLRVLASDLSADALELAKQNAVTNQVEIEFFQGDLLEPVLGQEMDFLVCNPPYIPSADIAGLDADVRDFEPKEALDGGEDGLDLYRRLAKQMVESTTGSLEAWLEIGTGQGEAVKELFGFSTEISCDRDWSGHDRFVHFKR